MRYVIYARYSSVGQNPVSCQQQIDAFRSWAAARDGGWEEVAGPYTDEAISGYKHQRSGRAGLDELIKFIEAGFLDGGVIGLWSTSRLSRQFSFIVPELIRLHEQHGVLAADTKYGVLDMSTTQGRLLLTMSATMDEEYSAEISRSSKRGIRDRALAGYWPYKRIPYGTNLVESGGGKILAPGRNHGHLLTIFRLRREHSVSSLAREMGRRGAPTPHTSPHWRPGAVSDILRNPAYLGKVPYRGQLIDGKHAPIVDPGLWSSVQFGSVSRPQRGPSQTTLTGLVFCGECGSPCWRAYARSQRGGGPRLTYMRCRTQRMGTPCQHPAAIRDDLLEEMLFKLLDDMTQGGHAMSLARLTAVTSGDAEARAQAAHAAALSAETRIVEAIASVPDSAALVAKLQDAVDARRQAEDILESIRSGLSGPQAIEAMRTKIARREGSTLREAVRRVEIFSGPEKRLLVWLNFTKSNKPIALRV